jgi:hypothetical protein
MVGDQWDPGSWHESAQSLDEGERGEYHVRGSVAPFLLQLVHDEPVAGAGEAFGDERRAGYVSAELLQSVAGDQSDADTGVEGEALQRGGELARAACGRRIWFGVGLCANAAGAAPFDRRGEACVLCGRFGVLAVRGGRVDDPGDAAAETLDDRVQVVVSGRVDLGEAESSVRVAHVHAIEDEHMEVHIEAQGRVEALQKTDGA